MGVSDIGGSSAGRRRSLDAEINLVPFIDLLSMCICFLLMAAVWTQLSAVQVKQSTGTEAAPTTQKSVEIEAKFVDQNQLAISIKKAGKAAAKPLVISGASELELLNNLERQLSAIEKEIAQESSHVGSVMVTPAQNVSYGSLVSVMDLFRKHQMINIGVVPVKPKVGG